MRQARSQYPPDVREAGFAANDAAQSERLVMLYCVIPAYRAAQTVGAVVAQALQYADAVVVVDDGCPQHSGEVVRAAYAGDPAVHVLIRERNGGVGAAM